MYYESFFSLRQDSTKISNIPIASYVYLENKYYANEFHPFWIRLVLRFFRFFYIFFFKKHLDKIGCGTRQKYGHVLFKHSCAIHPVDSGTEFFDDSLGDRLRFAYGYRTHKPSALLITLLEFISLGALWILFHWFPLIKFLLSHYPCRLLQATHVVLVTQKGEEHVINVFRPFISPCEAVNFDNWPALCTFCGMKQKLYKEGPSENWKSINDNLLKKPDLLKEYIDNQKIMQENNKAFLGDLSEIYRDEWCTCGNKNQCNQAESTHTHLYMFRFRLLRYYLNLRENCFYLICFNTKFNLVALHNHLGKGIPSRALYESRERIYGSDTIKPYPLIRTIIEELTEPFYVFQILSVALWIWDDYLEYAYIVIAQMLISSIYDISIAREYERRILQLALDLNFDVNVFRSWMHKDNGFPQEIKWSSDLYENEQLLSKWLTVVTAASLQPGELFEIVKGMTLPCDTILLSGNVICSEKFLSGESTPQTKTCLPGGRRPRNCGKQRTIEGNLENLDLSQQTENNATLMKEYNIDEDAQHTLYAGTHVIELQPLAKSQRVLGLCIRTRFLSSHGRLIRSSLFPTGPFFDFNAQALSFFGYMFLFSLIGAGISIATGYYFNFTFQVIVIRTLDLFTDALPPALPAVLGMGIVVAMNHLSSHYKINCINAGRINLAGLIDTFVFDKTGTLTEQKLSLYGCIQVENSQCQLNSSKLSIQQKFYTNVLCRPSKYTTTHSSARKRERQKIKRKFAILKKQSLTGSTESRHFYSVSKQLHHFVKPKSASFGFLQIQPTLLKRHFVEAMATCHSLSLIDNTVRGDPLDSTLLHFTGWKIHNIQDDITQVEQFMLVLRKTIGKDKRLLKHFKPFLKFSSQEIVTRQIFDLYKTNHTLPTIIKPPQEPISLLQTIRHTRFSHILTTLSEIQADNSASYASLMAINIKPYLIYLTKLSNTINQKKFPKNQLNELAILRRFAFTPSLKRVTVIVRNPMTENIYVYTKGSPETMVSLCKTTSLPASFYSSVAYYTRTGHRIVIVCGRSLGKLSGSLVDSLTRKQVEKKLILLGFVLFSNRLKLDTCETIQKLNQGHCRCILTTGDNPLTALSVAEKSGIIENNKKHKKKIILGDLYVPAEPSTQEMTKTCFIWTKISKCFEANTYKTRKHPKVLKRKRLVKKKEVNIHIEMHKLLEKKWNKRVTLDLKDFLCGKNPRDFEFILTGRAYRKLRMLHETLQLQWFDEATSQRSIPNSLPFTSYTFNNTLGLFNDWKNFSISKKKNTLTSIFENPRNFSQQILNHVPNFFFTNFFTRDTSEYAEFNDSSLKMASLKTPLLDSPFKCDSYNDKINLVTDPKVLPLVQQRTTEILSHAIPFTNSSSGYIGKFLLKEYPFDILSQPSMSHVIKDSLTKQKTIHESRDQKQHNNCGQNTKIAISAKFRSLTVYSPCTIFNRLGFIHPYKTGSLKRFDRQHLFSFSSLIHASILATGNHPKMLSNRIIFQDSRKKIEKSFNNHLLVFGSQFQESIENFKQCESRKLSCVHACDSNHPIHNHILCNALKSSNQSHFDSLPPYSFPYPLVYIFHTKLKKIRAFRVLHRINSHFFTTPYQEYLKKIKMRSRKSACVHSSQRRPYYIIKIIPQLVYNIKEKSSSLLNILRKKIVDAFTLLWLSIPIRYTKRSECHDNIVPQTTIYTTLSTSCDSSAYLHATHQAGSEEKENRTNLVKWFFGWFKMKFDTPIQKKSLTSCLLPSKCVSFSDPFNISSTHTAYDSANLLRLSSPNEMQTSTSKRYRVPLLNINQGDNYNYSIPQTQKSLNDISNLHLSPALHSNNLQIPESLANSNFPRKNDSNRCYNASNNFFAEENATLKVYDAPLRVNHSTAEFQTHFPSEFLEKNLLEHMCNMDVMSLSVAVFQNTSTFKNKEHNNSLNIKQFSSLSTPKKKKGNSHDHVHVSINDCQNEDCYPQLIRIWLFEYLLRQTRVYAGMLPEDKTSLVSTLRSLPYTFAVGMCGDGANDSGALRAADVGISLNNEEASVVAPFMSQNASISCCTAVLCEGRTSLENAIEMFSFIVFYSLIQYTSVVMLYLYGLNFSDNQYLFVDFFVILPLSTILSKKHHSTQFKATVPNVNLFSKYFVLHIVLHTAIGAFCMILLLFFLRFTPGWVPCYITPLAGDSDGAEVASYENTAIFYFSNFLYPLLTILSIYENRWKEEKFKNWLFGVCYTLLIIIFFIVIVYPRPGTILIPTEINISPKPLPIPPIKSIDYLAHLLIIVDQTLVLVKLPNEANILIFTLLLLCISISALVQILVLNPIKKQEEFYSNYCRQYNNEFIPINTKRNKLEVYQCF